MLHIKTFSLTLNFIFIAPDFQDMKVFGALGFVPIGLSGKSALRQSSWLGNLYIKNFGKEVKHDMSSENVCFIAVSKIKSIVVDF